ncbi:MAG: hypothetical protein PHG04_03985 [Candidatus Nanoarchaeia archaeon]|nr:hypothetical protein [Candidatus Nanoarchaeia archaeon]MDD5054505.1 hypothetical protein [Candidatus Nanoarchaeia archaeon]
MGKIISGKKIKIPRNENIDSYDKTPIGKIIEDFEKLKKTITDEAEKEAEPKYTPEDYKKPVFPLYCPNCGKGMFTLSEECIRCENKIDYSQYDKDFLGSISETEELFFFPGTPESFTHDLTNDLIILYYLSTPDSNYLDIANNILSAKNNMTALGDPFGFSSHLERILNGLNFNPDNKSLTKNLSPEFSSNMTKITVNLLNQMQKYLETKSIGNYNYLKINNYLFKQIIDKSIFGEE